MKIAIFSDSHDHVPNLEKFLDWVKNNQVEQLIFCGDLCAPAVVKNFLGAEFNGPIHMVFGNVADREREAEIASQFSHIKHHGDLAEFVIAGIKIAVIHYPDEAKKLAETGEYDLVFYGHNHTPWEETIGKTKLVNPGTLAGMFNKATFAVYDTVSNKLELKLLEKI